MISPDELATWTDDEVHCALIEMNYDAGTAAGLAVLRHDSWKDRDYLCFHLKSKSSYPTETREARIKAWYDRTSTNYEWRGVYERLDARFGVAGLINEDRTEFNSAFLSYKAFEKS